MGETKQARSKYTQSTDPLTNTNRLILLRTHANVSLKAKNRNHLFSAVLLMHP